MVKVVGSTGKTVEIQMLGIAEVNRRLLRIGQSINDSADLGVVKAGVFVEEEVKESIAGNRAEPRSVRTGLFGNSIEFSKTGEHQGVVKSNPTKYPDSNVTTEDVARFLEDDRMHFHNTKARTENEIQEIIKKEIKLGVQKF